MKKTLLALVGVLVLAGCGNHPSSITYFKDHRTGLCFAAMSDAIASNYTMTCVPCTPEVERLVEK